MSIEIKREFSAQVLFGMTDTVWMALDFHYNKAEIDTWEKYVFINISWQTLACNTTELLSVPQKDADRLSEKKSNACNRRKTPLSTRNTVHGVFMLLSYGIQPRNLKMFNCASLKPNQTCCMVGVNCYVSSCSVSFFKITSKGFPELSNDIAYSY